MRFGNFAIRNLNRYNSSSGEFSTTKSIYKKSTILLGITFLSAISSMILTSVFPVLYFLYFILPILTLIFGLIIAFRPLKAKALAIPYVICEGITIGLLISLINLAYPDIGLSIASYALLITIGIYFGVSLLYHRLGIRIPSKFIRLFLGVLLGVCLASIFFSILNLVVSLVSDVSLYGAFYSSGIGIVISVLMVLLSSIYVFINIQSIDQSVQAGMDKDYEWYAAYGLALSVIWLFIEVLELLLKIVARSRK